MFSHKRKYTASLMGGKMRRVKMSTHVRYGGAISPYDSSAVSNVTYSHGPVMYKQPESLPPVKTLPQLAGGRVASKPMHSVKPLSHPVKSHGRKMDVMDEIGKALSMM